MVEPRYGGSVNGWIHIAPLFVIMLYGAIIIITTIGVISFVKKKVPFPQALRKSIIIAFFCSGFLYLVHSESTWYTWFSEDVEKYPLYSTEAKTRVYLGPLYDFVTAANKVLKDNEYTIYSSDGGNSLMLQYYLLPKRNRANAKNIIVTYDNDAAYDEHTKTFIKGDRHIENAELLYRYDSGAYILRVK